MISKDKIAYLLKQILTGMDVEREHTKDEATALKIALDHLKEHLNYYETLKKVNLSIEKALPPGTVRQRKDGKYKKSESGQWVRVRDQAHPLAAAEQKEREKKRVDQLFNEMGENKKGVNLDAIATLLPRKQTIKDFTDFVTGLKDSDLNEYEKSALKRTIDPSRSDQEKEAWKNVAVFVAQEKEKRQKEKGGQAQPEGKKPTTGQAPDLKDSKGNEYHIKEDPITDEQGRPTGRFTYDAYIQEPRGGKKKLSISTVSREAMEDYLKGYVKLQGGEIVKQPEKQKPSTAEAKPADNVKQRELF